MQVNAYLDNMIDVAMLLEDSDTKNAALEKVSDLEEALSHVSSPRGHLNQGYYCMQKYYKLPKRLPFHVLFRLSHSGK